MDVATNSTSTAVVSISSDWWIFRLVYNLLGYCLILVPGALVIYYIKKSEYFEKNENGGIFYRILRLFVKGADVELLHTTDLKSLPTKKSLTEETLTLLACFFGLQGSYLTWGIIQEKIMTKEYYSGDTGNIGRFTDSQFLVFMNRVLALLISGIVILITSQPRHTVPIYKYSYASFSNIMSSWCQYEALKFVSFPTQVLAKASKIIPVMLMGKVVSNKVYHTYEYITALMISFGMALFLYGNQKNATSETVTTFSGIFILAGYMIFDSFTSNWQGKLFTQHKMSPIQMMCGVNFFSCLFTFVSLSQQGSFSKSLLFIGTYPTFFNDVFILSICSACGQLFIFKTISTFGPVVFVIMTTVRQSLAVMLSCLIYHHTLTLISIVGVTIIFLAIFLRIYSNHKLKAASKKAIVSRNSSNV